MNIYNVDMIYLLTVTIGAADMREAVEQAQLLHPDYIAFRVTSEDQTEKSAVQFCAFCNEPKLDGDAYAVDDQGNTYCECRAGDEEDITA